MSDCPHCASFAQVAQDAEAAAQEERLKAEAALRAASSERKRADRIEAKLETQHAEAQDAKTVRACLAVWEEHCWGGKTKPCLDLTSDKADRVRKALEWERISPDDVCDSFRGLGLLPYEGPYGKRSATKKPGFQRKSGVEVALRDSSRLERFRDYYRRVQSTPVHRLLEQWEQMAAVTDLMFTELLRARGREEREQAQEQGRQHGQLFSQESPPHLRLIESEAA
jgi:hypothetical protein